MWDHSFAYDEIKATIVALKCGEGIRLVRDDTVEVTVGRLSVGCVTDEVVARRFLRELAPVVEFLFPGQRILCLPESWVRGSLANLSRNEQLRVTCTPRIDEPIMVWAPRSAFILFSRNTDGE